jgi:uncharacterized protein (DUF2147 family)
MSTFNPLAMLRTLLFGLLLMLSLSSFAQSPLTGLWLNEDQNARIEIVETEAPFQGKLVWTDNQKGKETFGTRILRDLTPTKKGWEGTVYSPKQGDTYDATFRLVNDSKGLEMTVKVGFMSRTKTWTRVE